MMKREREKLLAIEYLQSGLRNFAEGLYETAEQDLKQVLTLDPHLVMAYCYLCMIYNFYDEIEKSTVICEKGLEFEPENPFLHFCLGRCYEKQGKLEDGIKEYEYFHQHSPHSVDCIFCIASACDQLGLYHKAQYYYSLAIELDSGCYQALFNLALIAANEERDDQAISYLKQAVKVKPDFWKAWVKLAMLSFMQDNLYQALTAYRQAVAIKDDHPNVLYNFGITCSMLEQYEEAVLAFKKAVSLKPDDIDAWYHLAMCYMKLQSYHNAKHAFQQILLLNLAHEEAHYRLGHICFMEGDVDKARRELQFLEDSDSKFYGALQYLLKE